MPWTKTGAALIVQNINKNKNLFVFLILFNFLIFEIYYQLIMKKYFFYVVESIISIMPKKEKKALIFIAISLTNYFGVF